jgi:hypothetical protein
MEVTAKCHLDCYIKLELVFGAVAPCRRLLWSIVTRLSRSGFLRPPGKALQQTVAFRYSGLSPENASPGRKHRQFITAGEVRLRASRREAQTSPVVAKW